MGTQLAVVLCLLLMLSLRDDRGAGRVHGLHDSRLAIVVPVLVTLNVDPEAVLAAYRVADSPVNAML